MEDTEIARGLLQKAIDLDDNLIVAKNKLGWIYHETDDYDKAMKIHTSALKQAKKSVIDLGYQQVLISLGWFTRIKVISQKP